MRKRFIPALVLIFALMIGSTAMAAPVKMPDGNYFDAEYYAATYPDVKQVFGTNQKALYQHYVTFGKAEGRHPVRPAENAVTGDYQTDSFIEGVVALTNAERSKAGLGKLSLDVTLAKAAMQRSTEMLKNNYFDHRRPDGRDVFTVFSEYHVPASWMGENIAFGYTSPEEVVDGWMHSPAHRQNILNPNFKRIGIGYDDTYWTQLFAG